MVDQLDGGLDITREPPTPEEFTAFRSVCGWGAVEDEVAACALQRGLLNLSVRKSGEIVGFGRVVGDGVLYFYVQDVIVAARWRGRGLGRLIVRSLLDDIRAIAPPTATIGLMAARGREAFYERLGFTGRPTPSLGAGMTQLVGPSMPTS